MDSSQFKENLLNGSNIYSSYVPSRERDEESSAMTTTEVVPCKELGQSPSFQSDPNNSFTTGSYQMPQKDTTVSSHSGLH
jgi:hypothetical protein